MNAWENKFNDCPILDALEDFDKPIPSSKLKKAEEVKPTEVAQADWSEEFMKQAATEFEKNISLLYKHNIRYCSIFSVEVNGQPWRS